MALGDLLVRMRADTAEFESDIGRAAHVMERDMERMVARASAAGELIGRAVAKIAGHMSQMVGETLRAGDELSKLSQRTGFAVERLSELKFAAELSDVGFRQLGTSLGFFEKALAEAQNESSKAGQTFRALGVDINAGPQKAFEQFLKAIDTLPNAETKVAAMRVAFSRTGDTLIPMIGQLDELSARARRLGLVMSDQLARDSERFNDALTTLQASLRALAITALTPASQALATIAENMVLARERGTGFRDMLLEIGKVAAATYGELLQMVGASGAAEQMFRRFQELERIRQGVTPGASGRWGEPDGPVGPPRAAANPEAVACAVSGGKWIDGRCVRQRESTGRARGGRQPMSFDELLARNAQTRLKMEEEMERESTRIAEEAEEQRLRDRAAGMQAYFKSIDEKIEHEEIAMRLIAGFDADGRPLKQLVERQRKATEEISEFWKAAAQNIQRSLADFLFDGMQGNLRDLGARFKQTLDRMVADALAAQALIKAGEFLGRNLGGTSSFGPFGTAIGSLFNFFQGTQAPTAVSDAVLVGGGSGYARGTDFVPRTGIALVHQGERITPPGGGRESRAPNIVFHITTPNADSFRASQGQIMADAARLMQGSGRYQ